MTSRDILINILISTVEKMRYHQRLYIEKRDKHVLIKAKELEREVDYYLVRLKEEKE